MRISLRELFWLTLVAAMVIGWWLHWRSATEELARLRGNKQTLTLLRILEAERGKVAVEVERERLRLAEAKSNASRSQIKEMATAEVQYHQLKLERAELFLGAFDKRIQEVERAQLQP